MSETTSHEMKMTYVIVPEAEYLNREASEMVYAGQHENAIALFDRALTLDLFSADTWYNKGNCLDDLGRQGDAIECYDHAIRFDPCHAEAWFAKGVSLKKMGKFPEAERCIDQAVRLAQGLAE